MNCEPIKNPEKYGKCAVLTKEKLQYALSEALKKIDGNLETFATMYPAHASVNNVYAAQENNTGWNCGFWTGMLWHAYELTGDEKYKKVAMGQIPGYMKRIVEKLGVAHHDMGFVYSPSCVAAHKLTGDEEAKKAAVLAADNLMTRYHEKGEFIQAWGPCGDDPKYYRLIVDCLLNIPLLYWASEATGDPTYDEVAFKHYKTTVANAIREDGSAFHTFYFDPATGKPDRGVTAQGFSDDSAWSRGQAWVIYGVMFTYMYKKNPDAFEFLKPAANYYLNRLPEDYVAYWDLWFTEGDEPRDSSSAANAACGCLEAVKWMDDTAPLKETYYNAACHIVNGLIDGYLTKDIPESNGLLLHAVYSKPGNNGVDECNIWGDYFYMEALNRLITDNQWKLYW